MASTKLTLSVEEAFVNKAKRYAAKHKTSLSKLFSEFVNEKITEDQLTEEDPFLKKIRAIKISEDIKSLTGILKGKYPDDMDYKDMKYEYLKEKHGL
jgi:hypothetical protein